MFGSFDSRRSVNTSGILGNKNSRSDFKSISGNSLSVDPLSENSKNPHDAVVSNHGHPAAGDKFSALDKGFRLTKSLQEHNGLFQLELAKKCALSALLFIELLIFFERNLAAFLDTRQKNQQKQKDGHHQEDEGDGTRKESRWITAG